MTTSVLDTYLADMVAMLDEPPAWHLHIRTVEVRSLSQRVRLADPMPTSTSDEQDRLRQTAPPDLPDELALRPRFKRGARTWTSLDWSTARDLARRTVVLGDPGYGKSWLLRLEAGRVAASALEGSGDAQARPIVPLLVPLRLWAARLESPDPSTGPASSALVEAGLDEWVRWRRRSGPEVTDQQHRTIAQLLTRRLRSTDRSDAPPGICLLLDGWDEVHSSGTRAHLLEEMSSIADHIRASPTSRLVVTSRALGYTPPFGIDPSTDRTWTLLGMDDEDTQKLIDAWIPEPARRIEVATALSESSSLRRLSRIPLLCTFLCIAASRGPLPSDRAELYERLLGDLLYQGWRPPSGSVGPTVGRTTAIVFMTLRVLEQVALRMAGVGEGGVTHRPWGSELSVDALQDALDEVPEAVELQEIRSQAYTAARVPYHGLAWELSDVDGVLVAAGPPSPAAPRGGVLTFLHRTVHEYLVARALARSAETAVQPVEDLIARVAWMDPAWVEVIPLLVGRLHHEDPALARRCYAVLTEMVRTGRDPFQWVLSLAGRCLAEVDGAERAVLDDELIELAGAAAGRRLTSKRNICLALATVATDDALETLSRFLRSENHDLRTGAASAIASVRPPRLLERLLQMSEPAALAAHPWARASLLQAMHGYADARIGERAWDALTSGRADERWAREAASEAALSWLLRYEAPATLAALTRAMPDPSSDVHDAWILAMHQVYEAESLVLLQLATISPGNPSQRGALRMLFIIVMESFYEDVSRLALDRIEAGLVDLIAGMAGDGRAGGLRGQLASIVVLSSSGRHSARLARSLVTEDDPDVLVCYLRSIARAPDPACFEGVAASFRRVLDAFAACTADQGGGAEPSFPFPWAALDGCYAARLFRDVNLAVADTEPSAEDVVRMCRRSALARLLRDHLDAFSAIGVEDAVPLVAQLGVTDLPAFMGDAVVAFGALQEVDLVAETADMVFGATLADLGIAASTIEELSRDVYRAIARLQPPPPSVRDLLLVREGPLSSEALEAMVAHPTPAMVGLLLERSRRGTYAYGLAGALLALVGRFGPSALAEVMEAVGAGHADPAVREMVEPALRMVASELDGLRLEEYRDLLVEALPDAT